MDNRYGFYGWRGAADAAEVMEPVREKKWKMKEAASEVVEGLVTGCRISSMQARLLANRQILTCEEAKRFLSSALSDLNDPTQILDMERAVERIAAALANRERICVYGDYDVDGVTSVALLVDFLRALGADCFYHIPHRLEEGYGLSAAGIRSVADAGARVIITCDCGITAVSEAELCSSLGIDLIITDHHTPGEAIPVACAVLNPLRQGCNFPFKYLAGVGVAFNLVMALRGRLRQDNFFDGRIEPNLRQYLDLVALGTIADIVPLVDDNRIFVKYGLGELAAAQRVGVEALKTVSGVNGGVGAGVVGFRLAPRLNAAGRLEDAALGVELLLSADPCSAAAMAAELDANNAERQAVEQEILREALSLLKEECVSERSSIVLASESWHPGVIGIVASRIVELFHRPTILIALQEGNGRGSGRSIPGFHLHDALSACAEHLLKFGGHKHAAGLSIDEETLEAFVSSFEEVAAGQLSEDDLLPELAVDAELTPEIVTNGLLTQVMALAPFGMGNPEPTFLMTGLTVVDRRLLKERHLKLKLKRDGIMFDAIGFGMGEKVPEGDKVDIVFCLHENEWNGRKSLQLRLKDVREVSCSGSSVSIRHSV